MVIWLGGCHTHTHTHTQTRAVHVTAVHISTRTRPSHNRSCAQLAHHNTLGVLSGVNTSPAPSPLPPLRDADSLAASSSVEGMAGISSHLNHLHLSTSSPYTGQPQPTAFTGQPQPQPQPTAYHSVEMLREVDLSQLCPLLCLQEHSSELHSSAGDSKAHHIQVITPDHTPSVQDDPSHPVHLYYPNR